MEGLATVFERCELVAVGKGRVRKREGKRLGTIRRIPDELWMEVQPLLPREKKRGTNGRPAVPFRKVPGWHTVRAADWLPVEGVTLRVWLRLHMSQTISRVG